MKVRVISGAVFVALITGFFLLREFVNFSLFNVLLWFFSVVGSIEVIRAVNIHTNKTAEVVAIVCSCLFVPLFCIVEYFYNGYGFIASLIFVAVQSIVLACFKGRKRRRLYNILPAIYPNLFILSMLIINYMPAPKGFIALLLVFVIAPFADTFAYFTGSLIGGKKLCPVLSPKKTWSGAIGGTIGGAIGALVVYYLFGVELNIHLGYVLFIILGLATSVATIFGDLFASFIKRKVGIKDYGNIMPGHGGVMDRIDGISFASVFIMLAFMLV